MTRAEPQTEVATMSPRWKLVSIAPALIVGLMITACTPAAGDGGQTAEQGSNQQAVGIDINPRDRRDLREGGELRIAAHQLPDNWNYYQVDGPTVTGTG